MTPDTGRHVVGETTPTGLSNQIYQALRSRIQTCDLLPGSDLSEKQLMDGHGYGRTPLREALLALQRDGLVEIFPRKGMRVTPFTEKSINDVYQLRKLLEPAVMSSYVSMYSKSDLLDFARRFRETSIADIVEHYELDIAFHTFLVSIADNEAMSRIHSELMSHVFRLAMYALVTGASHPEQNNPEHLAVVEALLRENEQEAKDALIFHINHSLIVSLNAVRERNEDASA